MEFGPDYIIGLSKLLLLNFLTSALLIYLFGIENQIIIFMLFIIIFFAVLILKNKKWIKRVKIDPKKAVLRIEYPLNVFGQKTMNLSISEIKKATYYEYMSRTPAHFTIVCNGSILRFNCSGIDSKKLKLIFEKEGIETDFYHRKENVGTR